MGLGFLSEMADLPTFKEALDTRLVQSFKEARKGHVSKEAPPFPSALCCSHGTEVGHGQHPSVGKAPVGVLAALHMGFFAVFGCKESEPQAHLMCTGCNQGFLLADEVQKGRVPMGHR